LLDNPKRDVHHSACGALKNISYGPDHDNKIAIKNCDGIPALVRLLRKAREQDLTDTITGSTTVMSYHLLYRFLFSNEVVLMSKAGGRPRRTCVFEHV
jgi:hypothetical protein